MGTCGEDVLLGSSEFTSLALNNLDYFTKDSSCYAEKFTILFRCILDYIEWLEVEVEKLKSNLEEFDFSESIKGSGYRSFILIFERCVTKCTRTCKMIYENRDSIFFCAEYYMKELEAECNVVNGLKSGVKFLMKLRAENKHGALLSLDKQLSSEVLLKEYGQLNQIGFYGRCQGFYYCESMRRTLQGVSVIMASFSEIYEKTGKPVSRAIGVIINGKKNIFNPELRAQQIVHVAQNSSLEFVKTFWSLTENDFMKKVPSWICSKVQVRKEIIVPPEPITLKSADCTDVVIPAPSSHIPAAAVRCLLLSTVCREGQQLQRNMKHLVPVAPPSPALLIHCHGGGFIAQSPESHESSEKVAWPLDVNQFFRLGPGSVKSFRKVSANCENIEKQMYLRDWAQELNVPILSIDYSLAPAAAFPRALEEVLLAYAWSLKNSQKLGWTGERVCFVGDSAGGNILMGTLLRTIALGIRKPDAILCAYTPLMLDMIPSPSRLLCWLDPLLPLGFMLSCLGAYAGVANDDDDDDEYMVSTDEKDSKKERKHSTIVQIFGSGLTLIKEFGLLGTEASGPEDAELGQPVISDPEKTNGSVNHSMIESKNQNYPDESDNEKYIENYVNDFVEKYIFMKKKLSVECEDHGEHLLFNVPNDLIFNLKDMCYVAVNRVKETLLNIALQNNFCSKYLAPFLTLKPKPVDKAPVAWFSKSKRTISKKFKKLKVNASNPYMSPLLVSDDMLKQFPPTYFVSLHFDPCLDDSVTLARRIKALGQPVVLDILDGLPHGFLNFLPFSKDAHEGSNLCVKRLKEALQLSHNNSA